MNNYKHYIAGARLALSAKVSGGVEEASLLISSFVIGANVLSSMIARLS